MDHFITIRSFLYSLTILLTLTWMTGCQPNDNPAPTFQEQRRVVAAQDIPDVTSALLNKLGLRNTSNGFSVYQDTRHDDFNVDWDQVYQLIDSAGSETYTFRVNSHSSTPFTFYNLVFKLDPYSEPETPYLVKYTMTEEFFPEYLETGSLENFRGTIDKMILEPSGYHNQNDSYNDTGNESVNATRCPDETTVNMTGPGNSGGGGPGGDPGGGNTGGGAVVVTTYQVCEYYLVTTTYDHYVNGQYAYTDQISSIEVDCYDLIITEAEAAMDDTGCEPLDDDIPILEPRLEDLIDDSQLRPCMKSVLNDLKKLTKGMSWMINRFNHSGTNSLITSMIPGYNWKMIDGTLAQGTGQTSSIYNKANATVTSTFDSRGWRDATDLSWARTVLHEAVHAYFVVYYSKNRPGFMGTYPQMVQDWNIYQNWNQVHHEEFARSLVRDIADALQEFGINRGYSLSRQFYEDMSWAGLQGTTTFNNLSPTDKQRILEVNSIELTKKDTNGLTKPQKGKSAGC